VNIIYEDDALLAVNKPEGISVIPERDLERDSLLKQLEAERKEKLFVIHRIDKDVSGLILFAKHPSAHRHFCLQFERRKVDKVYSAVAHGAIEPLKGFIDKPLREFGSGRMGVDVVKGKACRTAYSVLENHGSYAFVRISPLTGRRHQIRVHFYSIGHSLVGDRMYGDKTTQSCYARLMLHSLEMTIRLPNDKPVTLSAPLPPSFVELEKRCKEGAC